MTRRTDEFGIRPESEEHRPRWRWRVWLLAGDFAVLGVVVVLSQWPIARLNAVTYDGPAAWEEKARSCVTLPADSNLVHVDLGAIEACLGEAFGDLAEARVKLTPSRSLALRLRPTEVALWTSARSGIAADGAWLSETLATGTGAVWCEGVHRRREADGRQRRLAAGCWASVLRADQRLGEIVSEWTYEHPWGWVATAADGRTRIILGKAALQERAHAVALLLDQDDAWPEIPCLIDARFAGQILVRPLRDAQRGGKQNGSGSAPKQRSRRGGDHSARGERGA